MAGRPRSVPADVATPETAPNAGEPSTDHTELAPRDVTVMTRSQLQAELDALSRRIGAMLYQAHCDVCQERRPAERAIEYCSQCRGADGHPRAMALSPLPGHDLRLREARRLLAVRDALAELKRFESEYATTR